MSADNFISIIKQKDGTFKAFEGSSSHDYEEGELEKSNPVFTADSMEDAVKKVQDYMEENYVEYGYHFYNV